MPLKKKYFGVNNIPTITIIIFINTNDVVGKSVMKGLVLQKKRDKIKFVQLTFY